MAQLKKPKWWQEAVFYQIYPRSFADLNGDGISDFPGMAAKLDYVRDLGVDAIWLSPHFPSPLVDVGYDVSDYTGVAPEYGTLDDFRAFLDSAHQRGLRVILDFVLNHTSDQHPWFRESRSSRDNPYRDWYIWRPGRNGGPPNNWISTFGGSAWELDPATGEYYYHFFFKEQPDLNWRNPAVRQAMWNAARFWYNMGVDGFRLDAVGTIFEDPDLTDHDSSLDPMDVLKRTRQAKDDAELAELGLEAKELVRHQVDLPEVHSVMRELRAVTDEYDDRVLVGEADDLAYHGSGDDELHLVFNFPLMRTRHMTPAWVRANQVMRLKGLPRESWPCNTLGNHDSPRLLSRYCAVPAGAAPADQTPNLAFARVLAAMVTTLAGTPFLYYGEEIGMADYYLDDIFDFRDTLGTWYYDVVRRELGVPEAQALMEANARSRDKCRTPMQWQDAPNAGFCPANVRPWLPVNPDYAAPPAGRGANVAAQEDDPDSMLEFYRRLLRVRRENPALRLGRYQALNPRARNYLAYVRSTREGGLTSIEAGEPQACLVALNFTGKPVTARFKLDGRLRCVFSTAQRDGDGPNASAREVRLSPYEVFIGELLA